MHDPELGHSGLSLVPYSEVHVDDAAAGGTKITLPIPGARPRSPKKTPHPQTGSPTNAPSSLNLGYLIFLLISIQNPIHVPERLRSLLAKEPLPASDVLYHAKEDGISARALRNAFNAIGGRHIRKGFGTRGKWLWTLNAEQANTEPQAESQNQEHIDPRDCSDYEQ